MIRLLYWFSDSLKTLQHYPPTDVDALLRHANILRKRYVQWQSGGNLADCEISSNTVGINADQKVTDSSRNFDRVSSNDVVGSSYAFLASSFSRQTDNVVSHPLQSAYESFETIPDD